MQSPKGRQRQRNRSKGELKVVRRELSSSSSTCQNPFLASTVENTFALESSGSMVLLNIAVENIESASETVLRLARDARPVE